MDSRVLLAHTNCGEIDKLLCEYLPLVKREVLDTIARGSDYEDMLSIAMMAFVRAIRQFQPQRGTFIPYARLCIRSRVLDELRKTGRQNAVQFPSLGNTADTAGQQSALEAEISLAQYSRDMERRALQEELGALRQTLLQYSVPFDSLVNISPKQKRSQDFCLAAARCVLADEAMRRAFEQNQTLMPAALAGAMNVSPKTVEKHRRYIVVLLVILRGDYPCIRAFLPRETNSKEGSP